MKPTISFISRHEFTIFIRIYKDIQQDSKEEEKGMG